MRDLHIIMPMAGEGSRFKNEGWTTPKPLIQLNGQPLFRHALNSISSNGFSIKHTFIVRQEHIDKYSIDKEITKTIPDANIVSVLETTRGAVETCMLAKNFIDDNDGVVVMDCDLEFESKEYISKIIKELCLTADEANGGVLVSFTSDLPKYSYALTDDNGKVIKTAEKEVISNHALCGAYFFSTGRDFKAAAHELLNDPDFDKPEFYISLLFNRLIKNKQTVELAKVDSYKSFGTPEELRSYL